jgi:hypothetical protein
MAKFRKKPVVVDAWKLEFNNHCRDAICEIANNPAVIYPGPDGGIYINTLEGKMYAATGDYIIKGDNGEFYPCKPDIFEKTYEVVE